jgi:hypothetical protein
MPSHARSSAIERFVALARKAWREANAKGERELARPIREGREAEEHA